MVDLIYQHGEGGLAQDVASQVAQFMLSYNNGTNAGEISRCTITIDDPAADTFNISVIALYSESEFSDQEGKNFTTAVSDFVADLDAAFPAFWPTVTEDDIEGR